MDDTSIESSQRGLSNDASSIGINLLYNYNCLPPLRHVTSQAPTTFRFPFKGEFTYRKIRHFAEKISLVLNASKRRLFEKCNFRSKFC